MNVEEFIKNNEEIHQYVSKLPEYLKQNSVLMTFNTNSTVFKKGEKTEYAYLLLTGEVTVLNEFEDGNCYLFSRLRPFSFLSDLEILSGQMINTTTLITNEDCILLSFKADDFSYCLKTDPEFLMLVAVSLAQKMYDESNQMGNSIYQLGINKVIMYLIKYYQKTLKDMDNLIIVNRSRQIIASEIGISIKTVNRSISSLKKMGLIDIANGKIKISENQYMLLLNKSNQVN